MRNNSHNIEPLNKRLDRFQKGEPIESIDTLINSIANSFNNEITVTSRQYQTSLLFLGIHAVALTISEIFWGLRGVGGYRKFLEEFVDGETEGMKFSFVADKIHNWRNVLAHQWLSSSGYEIQYEYELKHGFIVNDNVLMINPRIYCDHYLSAFAAGGKIYEYSQILSDLELERAKQRIIEKFVKQ